MWLPNYPLETLFFHSIPSVPKLAGPLRACSVIFNPYRLEGIERDFDLLGIETPSIPLNLYGLG
jgi:hypothetical protein